VRSGRGDSDPGQWRRKCRALGRNVVARRFADSPAFGAEHAAGLTQSAVARLAQTSRPTLSAYEHGRKSPTLDTAARVLAATGHVLNAEPIIEFTEQLTARGRVLAIPTHLPRLPVEQALRRVVLPLHLNWSDPGRTFDLADRQQRARVYEIVLREGGPDDVRTYIDGALLVDLWDVRVLPAEISAAWAPLFARLWALRSERGSDWAQAFCVDAIPGGGSATLLRAPRQ